MPKLTDEKIAKLKALCEKATPGPWGTRGLSDHIRVESSAPTKNVAKCGSSKPSPREPDMEEVHANAEFIAAARTALPDLLSDLEEARLALADARNKIACAWCGKLEEKGDSPEEMKRRMAEHIIDCELHPVRKLAYLLAILQNFLDFAPRCAQLLDGWHADGTTWSEWDESVRKELSDIQRDAEAFTAGSPRAESAERALATIFCDAHRPNASRTYNGCLVCSRNEDAAMVEEFLKSLGWAHDEEAELNLHGWQWYCIGEEERGTWDTQTAFTKAIEDYNALRDAHKKARLALAQSERELAEARQQLPGPLSNEYQVQLVAARVRKVLLHPNCETCRAKLDIALAALPAPPETPTKEQP